MKSFIHDKFTQVSMMGEVDPGWMVEGQATKGWNQDCLDSQMDGWHANQGSLHFMLSKSKTTTTETRIYSQHERSDLDTKTNQMWL